MSKYMEKKEAARNEAIDLHSAAANDSMSWSELAERQEHLTTIGRRYGMIREFRENGII